MTKSILEQAKQIAQQDTAEKYEEAMALVEDYLKTNKHDTDAWLLLARIECNPPFEIPDRVINYIEPVLTYDPTNAYALLFLAFAHYYLMGRLDDETYQRLCCASDKDPEVMAMVELVKAEYWELKDQKKYEDALLKSIGYSTKQFKNLSYLGNLYISQGKKEEGTKLIERAKKNVKIVDYKSDPTDIDSFFDWYYKGTEMPKIVLEAYNKGE